VILKSTDSSICLLLNTDNWIGWWVSGGGGGGGGCITYTYIIYTYIVILYRPAICFFIDW